MEDSPMIIPSYDRGLIDPDKSQLEFLTKMY